MNIFKFEVGFIGVFGEYIRYKEVRANHLQGAIRQLYQNESGITRIVRILQG